MIIATAGHIDHGKTALLAALTGQAGDHRREEQSRGITIDLGYRYASLGDGDTLGFIDVPCHERFVHNMLAGAGGVDLALLVVAADDGVMPQTREHLAILALLGIPRLWLVLTKCDRVDAAQQAAAEADIRNLLATTTYRNAPGFRVSSITGEGVDELRQALVAEAGQSARSNPGTWFRLSVDRAFSISGAGTVVTGTALAGRIAVGDSLLLARASGEHQTVRVRGLHAQNQVAEQARGGQRVAINLAGDRLKAEQIERGSWLLQPELLNPSRRLDIQLSLLPDAPKALAHWSPVHIHLGAQHLTGRVALLEQQSLSPGQTGLAQLVMNGHCQAVWGDRVVIRDQSARQTLGGGPVLDPAGPTRQRRSEARLAQLRALASGGLDNALPSLLAQADNGLAPDTLQRQFNQSPEHWHSPSGTLEKATARGPRLFSEAIWQNHQAALTDALSRFHQEHPDEPGPDRSRLRRYGVPYLEPAVFAALLDEALADKQILTSGPWLHRPDHQVRLSDEEEALKARLWPHLEHGGINPPWVRDLARLEDVGEDQVRALLRKLARLGQLHQVVRDLFYPESGIEQLVRQVLVLSGDDNQFEVIDFRDAVGLGRKRCVQLLEYLDRLGVTRRFGNQRRIRHESSMVSRVKTD
ncbi:selenocysteine-specific translation elongation factor [Marinobacter fuscus]|uniref:Selenocysteine-specific elongation factor n=1 Tax=Marinobacter fuscus TaxID=2109942 RepID=A0A2T1KU87_9GAMM|nr:selenocysteine-specific translation elongation factor [Marinobacter fuscus]PSF13272.1 selenocysteine-specific translation elongation factor [Marinobacter fuscus]